MNSSFFSFISFSNLVSPEFNAIYFSLFGMAMIFSGLVIISLYVVFLPKILRLPASLKNNRRPKAEQRVEQDEAQKSEELLLAIATALYLHQDFPEEQERITFKSHGDLDSPWKISGRVRGLSMRQSNMRKGYRR